MSKVHCLFVKKSAQPRFKLWKLGLWDAVSQGREERGAIVLEQHIL